MMSCTSQVSRSVSLYTAQPSWVVGRGELMKEEKPSAQAGEEEEGTERGEERRRG